MLDIGRSNNFYKVVDKKKCTVCVVALVVVGGVLGFVAGVKISPAVEILIDRASVGQCTFRLPHRCEKNTVKHKHVCTTRWWTSMSMCHTGASKTREDVWTLTYDANFEPNRPGASEFTCTWRGQSWGYESSQSVPTRMRLCEEAAAVMDTVGAKTCIIPDKDRPRDCWDVTYHTTVAWALLILGVALLVIGATCIRRSS